MIFKLEPFKHQFEAWDVSKDCTEYALFMDMGTGKSKVLLDTIAYLYYQKKINGAFILANKGSYLNWRGTEENPGQITIHLPDDIPRRVIVWINSDHGFKAMQKEFKKPFEGMTFFIMNIEALVTDTPARMATTFLTEYKCLMAVDESTTIKNRDAKRTKQCFKLGLLAHYRRILTGSPITNNPLDLWSQCHFLKPGLIGHHSFFTFRACYANLINMSGGQRSFKKIVGFKNISELTEKINTFSFRVKKSDCLDLPEKMYSIRYVEMTPEQKRIYNALREEAIVELQGGATATALLAITKLVKLHRVVCGHLKDDEGNTIAIESLRINEMMKSIEEADGKIIIWATYKHDIELITKAIGEEYGYSSLVVFDKDRAQAIASIQDEESQVRFFISNSATGGFGNTITTPHTVIYYSNNYRSDIREQSEDRAHRIGQKNPVLYIDLVCKGTVDEKIIKALRSKRKIAAEVLGDEWREWL